MKDADHRKFMDYSDDDAWGLGGHLSGLLHHAYHDAEGDMDAAGDTLAGMKDEQLANKFRAGRELIILRRFIRAILQESN